MPFANPEKKKQYMHEWRRSKMDEGYGKWLYARRKLRFDDAERFRKALEEILERPHGELDEHDMRSVAHTALEESRQAEEELGWFEALGT